MRDAAPPAEPRPAVTVAVAAEPSPPVAAAVEPTLPAEAAAVTTVPVADGNDPPICMICHPFV